MTLISYCTLKQAEIADPTDAAAYLTAATSVLAAGDHIHAHTHWDVVCPRWRRLDLLCVGDSHESQLSAPMPIHDVDRTVMAKVMQRGYLSSEDASSLVDDVDGWRWQRRLDLGAHVRVLALAGHGTPMATGFTLPDPLPSPLPSTIALEGSDTEVPQVGQMMLAGRVLCHVVLRGAAVPTVMPVPGLSPSDLEAGAACHTIYPPPDLQLAAATAAKRFAVMRGQPGAGAIGGPFQPTAQAPAINFGLTRTLNAYRRPSWA